MDAYRSARAADSGTGELSDQKGLTLLGDTSVASGNGIAQVAGAVGKLYSDLRAGQPIKDAADQLRDMGVISGETRTMLDRLLASGKSGPEVWAALRASLEQSSGAMKEQEQTLSSLQKGLQDAKDRLYTSFAEGSVPFEKDKLKAATLLYGKLQPAAQEAGDVYGGFKNSLSELVKKFLELIGVKAASDKALGDTSTVKNLTDAYIVLRIAMFAFGIIAIPALIGTAIAAGAVSIAVVGTAAAFALVVAAAVGAGAAIYMHRLHVAKASEALLAYVEASQQFVTGLEKQRAAITSTADKVKFLAEAYAALRKAREEAADTTKTPEERQAAEVKARGIQAEIAAAENNSGVLQRQRQKALEEIRNPRASVADRAKAQKKADDLEKRIAAGERASDSDLAPSEADAKVQAELKERASKPVDDEAAAKKAEQDARDARADADAKRRRADEMETDLERRRQFVRDRIRQREEMARRTSDPDEKKIIMGSATAVETSLDGVTQTTVQAREDANAAELNAQKKQDDAGTARKKVTDASDKKAKDDTDATDKKKQESDRAEKEAREQRIGNAEADAEAKLAAISSEGIQRAREEYEINRQLLEVKLREAEAEGDAAKLAKLKADYYRDAQGMARKEEENTKATATSMKVLNDQIATRQDAADRRQLERDAKSGKITEQQRRDGEAAISERQGKRLDDDARQKEQEARDALAKGDKDKAIRLTTEAQQLRAQADARRSERDDLLRPEQQRRTPIADDLRRIGGGGAAHYGSGRNTLEAKADETNRLLKANNDLLRESNRRENRVKVL